MITDLDGIEIAIYREMDWIGTGDFVSPVP
nr:MAG TPA: hypothetical protein [Caudoviricetes sp.]